MNIFEALREDHGVQRTLADLLVKTHGDSEGRDELFDKLKAQLQAHAKAEERYFYILLMEDDLTQEKARHSVAEHHEIDELIETMENTEFSSPAWVSHAEKLRKRLHHHLDEEEHEVFQMAGKVLTEQQKTSLSSEYRKLMEAEK